MANQLKNEAQQFGIRPAGLLFAKIMAWVSKNLALHLTLPVLKGLGYVDMPWWAAFTFSYIYFAVLFLSVVFAAAVGIVAASSFKTE